MASDRSNAGNAIQSVGALSAVGLSLVMAIIIGTAVGYGIDRLAGTSPWGFLIGFFLGLAAGIRAVFRTVASVSKNEDG